MENKKIGSITIFVIIIMASLLIVGATTLHTMTMLHNLAMHRVEITRQFHAAQSLLAYAIAQCKQIDIIIKKDKEYTYQLNSWPLESSKGRGQIKIRPQNNKYMIESTLYEGNRVACTRSCIVCKDKDAWRVTSFVE